MWSWSKRVAFGMFGLLTAGVTAGITYERLATRRELAATPAPGQLIDVGGHRLHLWCAGTGVPSVILETGLTGSTADWGFVQPEIARFTRVCSYDRAGHGYSDPGPSPRTARRIARELAVLLDRSGMRPPFVLVGASSGGLSARVFASEQRNSVAGLVLVDATHENQPHEIPRLARFVPILAPLGVLRFLGVSFARSPESLAPSVRAFARATSFRAAGYRAAADEIIHMRESASEVRTTRHPLTVPVVVVTGARGADPTWLDLQRDQVELSPRGCQIIAEESGHVVASDQPEIVVNATRAIVEMARGQSHAALCGPPGAAR